MEYILNAFSVDEAPVRFPRHTHYCRVTLSCHPNDVVARATEIASALRAAMPLLRFTLVEWNTVGHDVSEFNGGPDMLKGTLAV